jgi:hypothetical protein
LSSEPDDKAKNIGKPQTATAKNEISVWITSDGQLYFHNITADVIEMAHHISPENAEMVLRYAILQQNDVPSAKDETAPVPPWRMK